MTLSDIYHQIGDMTEEETFRKTNIYSIDDILIPAENTMMYRIHEGVSRELQRQKSAGKQFISNEDIDEIIKEACALGGREKTIFDLTDTQVLEIGSLAADNASGTCDIGRNDVVVINYRIPNWLDFRVMIYKNLDVYCDNDDGEIAPRNQYKVQELFRQWNVKPMI